jgi:lipopolysaccharide/colanic/teichoic acid biosynthesis glycosyltransferase
MSAIAASQKSAPVFGARVETIAEQDSPIPQRRWYPSVKRACDCALALLLLAVTSPFLLVAVVLTKLTSRGPVFYSQTRLGVHARPYTILKIRTMKHDCERQSGVRWCVPGDARVTWVGRFLRQTKVDELPQLWNVLRGEMSLVGPRPERPEIVAELVRHLPDYRERLEVLPGLTGLAQVQLPPDTDLESVCHKLRCDLSYVRNASLWLDGKVLVATPLYLLGLPARLLCKLFAFPC